MYVDASYDKMLLYVGMILLFTGLCFEAIKSKQYLIVFFGNIISFFTFYICTKIFYVKNWEWYFIGIEKIVKSVKNSDKW